MYQDYNMYDRYYRIENLGYRGYTEEEPSEELITLSEAIDAIKESVGDEKEDELFYEQIINLAPTEKEKNIIRSIKEDEKKHNRILRNIYFKLTRTIIPENQNTQAEVPKNNMTYEEMLEKALFGELEAVVRYRRIMGAMPDDKSHILLMSIMTDELRHADKYNYLISETKAKKQNL